MQLHVNASTNPDGTRNVSMLLGPNDGWVPAGRLMPQLRDSRQQPKSAAMRLIEKRNANAKMDRAFPRITSETRRGMFVAPLEQQDYAVCSNFDAWTPRPVYSTKTGKCIGTLMPRATQAELGYGIQGWSRPDYDTRMDAVVKFGTSTIISRGDV